MVERFLRELTMKRIRRGSFTSVAETDAAISDYIDQHNETLAYIWTATPSRSSRRSAALASAANKSKTV